MFTFSAVVSTQRSGFSALPFQNVECRDVFPRIRELGFEAVELAVRDPFFLNIWEIEEAINLSNLRLSALGTGQAYVDEGISLLARDLNVFHQAIERLKDHIALASLFPGCRVIVGCIRGKLSEWGQARSKGIAQFHRAMRELAELSYNRNVDMLIEPINRYETELINSLEECLEHIKQIGAPNIKILADTFHMNIEETNFVNSLMLCGSYLGHVHLAESNRSIPGTGHFDFSSLLDVLAKTGYKGDLAFEIVPGQDPLANLAEGMAYINKLGSKKQHTKIISNVKS